MEPNQSKTKETSKYQLAQIEKITRRNTEKGARAIECHMGKCGIDAIK